VKTHLKLLLALLVLGAPTFWLRVEAQTIDVSSPVAGSQTLFTGRDNEWLIGTGSTLCDTDLNYTISDLYDNVTIVAGTYSGDIMFSVLTGELRVDGSSLGNYNIYAVPFITLNIQCTSLTDGQSYRSYEFYSPLDYSHEYATSTPVSITNPMSDIAAIAIGIAWLGGLITFFGFVWMLRKQ